VAAWVVYDVLCRLLGRHEGVLALVLLGLVAGASYGVSQLFSGRATYIQIGAMLGTIMVANVFFVIIPGHWELVRAKEAGREPDPVHGIRGKQRSVHNNYLTLPVVFAMLANHFPSAYGHSYGWAILVAFVAIGAWIRHYFNLRHRGLNVWPIPVTAGLALLGIALAAVGPASLAGATLAIPLSSRFGLGRVMIAALLFEAISRLMLPFIAGTPVQVAVLLGVTQALVGLTEALWFVGLRTLQQSLTPDRLLGRVGAASNFVQFVVAPPAAIAAGLLGDAIGLRPTLFVQGVIATIALVYLYASPIRDMHTAPVVAADEVIAAAEHA
jgi:hypothetical protein